MWMVLFHRWKGCDYMKDILLDREGDIALSAQGDISLVTSPVQAVMIKIKWFFQEWVFEPEKGIPWHESILIKKPDTESIKKILIREILDVEDVIEVPEMNIIINAESRAATIRFQFRTSKEIYHEEVIIHG